MVKLKNKLFLIAFVCVFSLSDVMKSQFATSRSKIRSFFMPS